MAKRKFLTVVYTINNEEAFETERGLIMQKSKASAREPWAITAVSNDHEIHRLDLLQEALSNQDDEKVDALLEHPDVGNLQDLDELA